ncbi:VanZ family protein [Streptomyces sp. TS71-3]|uniref:VanZ family protein n=1 Tax=Streptomyces sp. TS71-3 TaxID=2733862 RepID=UPI001B14FD64|nr:VanZ family protein [Streptomyces sp. TS71-3]GHJ37374.1 hypothetical protein Sm713_29830 [Streptomyces sp. TS71-3]
MARKVRLFGFEIGKTARPKGGKGTKTKARSGKAAKGQGTRRGWRSGKDGDAGKAGGSSKTASKTSGSGRRSASDKVVKSAKSVKAAASRRPKGSAASGKRAGSGAAGSAGAAAGARTAPPVHAAVRVLVMLVAFAAMVGFAVVLAKVTLVPSPASVPLTHSNLHPGSSIRTYVDQPAFRETVKQIGGNIVLGVPFGLLLPVLFPKAHGLLRVAGITAAVMLLVELAQGSLVAGRAFDIDDVILNTAGSLVGYLILGRRVGRAVHPRRAHWWHRFTKPKRATAD